MAYNPAQQRVIDLLGKRPDPAPMPEDLADSLLAFLTDELAEVAERIPDGRQVVASKHGLGTVHGCEAHHVALEGTFAWSVPVARGSVVHKAIELTVAWRGEPHPLTLVEEALERLADGDADLSRFLAGLAEADRAQLLSEANALVAGFLEGFPPLKREWRPVCESRSRVELFDAKILLAGRVDLTLGGPTREADGRARSDKVIIDLKTGAPATVHRDDLRFYALVETLKLGVAPRLLATYYLDSARPQPEEVTAELLWAAARRTADGVRKMVALTFDGAEPAVRPGPACRWCPLQTTCPEGRVHLEQDAYG
jgi:RecB family exonuclease